MPRLEDGETGLLQEIVRRSLCLQRWSTVKFSTAILLDMLCLHSASGPGELPELTRSATRSATTSLRRRKSDLKANLDQSSQNAQNKEEFETERLAHLSVSRAQENEINILGDALAQMLNSEPRSQETPKSTLIRLGTSENVTSAVISGREFQEKLHLNSLFGVVAYHGRAYFP